MPDGDHLAQLPSGSLRRGLRYQDRGRRRGAHRLRRVRARADRAGPVRAASLRPRTLAVAGARGARVVMRAIWPLDPATYTRHPLHEGDRAWTESNCYVDLWIELLHSSGVEPLAALPFVFAVDLEGDQWTFFKFPTPDLNALYGVDVIELQIWRPIAAHLDKQLALGRPSLVEVDAFYLPDTAGTSYHAEHVKTTIGVQALDLAAQRAGYFHNAGYYELDGADFVGVFLVAEYVDDPKYLPPYVEVAKLGVRP